MKAAKSIANFYSAMFSPPTLEEVIGNELEKVSKEVMQCDHVIRTHRFQRHMALKRIEALEEWNQTEREEHKGIKYGE